MYRSSGCISMDLNWWFAVIVCHLWVWQALVMEFQCRLGCILWLLCLYAFSLPAIIMRAYAVLRILFFIKDFWYIKFRNVAVNLFERHPCHGVVVVINLEVGVSIPAVLRVKSIAVTWQCLKEPTYCLLNLCALRPLCQLVHFWPVHWVVELQPLGGSCITIS